MLNLVAYCCMKDIDTVYDHVYFFKNKVVCNLCLFEYSRNVAERCKLHGFTQELCVQAVPGTISFIRGRPL